MDLEKAHISARERGVSLRLYRVFKAVITTLLHVLYRFKVEGAENIPAEGPVIITPNHKSFFDTFFVGAASPRPVRYMAKSELISGPLGRFFVRMGAFPVQRGRSDRDAISSAKLLLEQGEIVVLFPEGTRVEQSDALGTPHHGAGRLSLESGVTIVPVAVSGTERLLLGLIPKLHRVQVKILPPIIPEKITEAESDSGDEAAAIVNRHVWPAVKRGYEDLRAQPGPVLATLAALGVGAGLVARRRAKAKTRQLGVVPPRKTRRQAKRKNLFGKPGKH